MTSRSRPSSRDRRPAVVIAAIGAASAIMNPIRLHRSPPRFHRQIGAAPGLLAPPDRHDRLGGTVRSSAMHCPARRPGRRDMCATRSAAPRGHEDRPASGPRAHRHRLGRARCGVGEQRRTRHRPEARARLSAARTSPISSRAGGAHRHRAHPPRRHPTALGPDVMAVDTRRSRSISASMLLRRTRRRGARPPRRSRGVHRSRRSVPTSDVDPCGWCGLTWHLGDLDIHPTPAGAGLPVVVPWEGLPSRPMRTWTSGRWDRLRVGVELLMSTSTGTSWRCWLAQAGAGRLGQQRVNWHLPPASTRSTRCRRRIRRPHPAPGRRCL